MGNHAPKRRYEEVARVEGFDGLRLRTTSPVEAARLLLAGQLPLQVATSAKVFVLQRQRVQAES